MPSLTLFQVFWTRIVFSDGSHFVILTSLFIVGGSDDVVVVNAVNVDTTPSGIVATVHLDDSAVAILNQSNAFAHSRVYSPSS